MNLSAVRGQKNTIASLALTSENVVRTWLKVFDRVPHIWPESPNGFEKVLIRSLFNVEISTSKDLSQFWILGIPNDMELIRGGWTEFCFFCLFAFLLFQSTLVVEENFANLPRN